MAYEIANLALPNMTFIWGDYDLADYFSIEDIGAFPSTSSAIVNRKRDLNGNVVDFYTPNENFEWSITVNTMVTKGNAWELFESLFRTKYLSSLTVSENTTGRRLAKFEHCRLVDEEWRMGAFTKSSGGDNTVTIKFLVSNNHETVNP